MKKEKLLTPKTYALQEGISVQWVYKLMEQNKIEFKEIDGIRFVKL